MWVFLSNTAENFLPYASLLTIALDKKHFTYIEELSNLTNLIDGCK